MGTIRRITDLQLGLIGTTKILNITTAATTWIISSGNRAAEVTNLGNAVYYGNSSVSPGTGGVILQYSSKFWDTIIDNFSIQFVNNSAGITSQIVIHEYQGNN